MIVKGDGDEWRDWVGVEFLGRLQVEIWRRDEEE